ncbi:MAG: HAD hydrolase-like protein [Elusimicrobiales bacterium]
MLTEEFEKLADKITLFQKKAYADPMRNSLQFKRQHEPFESKRQHEPFVSLLSVKMIRKYKHVIWDWNGTILDDTGLCVRIVNMLKAKRGQPAISVEKYRAIFGFPVKDYYIAAGFDFSRESFEEVGLEWVHEYEKEKFKCGLHSGVKEVLDAIYSYKIGQSILSAYSRRALGEMVGYYGLSDYFTHSYGLESVYAPRSLSDIRFLRRN